MSMENEAYDGERYKLEDGYYDFDGVIQICVEHGVMHVPAKMAPPKELMRSRTPLEAVLCPDGALRVFIRAGDLIKLRPDLEELVRAAADKFMCQV